jgi:hypothetical protein
LPQQFLKRYYIGTVPGDNSNRASGKHACAGDAEFDALLKQSSTKHLKNDFECHIETPNDVSLASSLEWYKKNLTTVPDLGKMARDVLVVPVSGSVVECVFSVSGRIATCQLNRLSPETISNLMMFKCVARGKT